MHKKKYLRLFSPLFLLIPVLLLLLAPEGVVAAEDTLIPPVARIDSPLVEDVYIKTDGYVFFEGTGSDEDGFIESYVWQIQGPTEDQFVEDPGYVQFRTTGSYRVSFLVYDDDGLVNVLPPSVTVHVNIGVSVSPPVALHNGPFKGYLGDTIIFDASESYDDDGEITSYRWDFGDGTTGEGPTLSHIYPETGNYNAILTLADNSGLISEASILVRVFEPGSPFADFTATPRSGTQPLMVAFTDDSLTETPVSSWLWEFGDGSMDSIQNPVHTYTTSGSFHVKLKINDSVGNSDTETKSSYIIIKGVDTDGDGVIDDEEGSDDYDQDGISDAFDPDTTVIDVPGGKLIMHIDDSFGSFKDVKIISDKDASLSQGLDKPDVDFTYGLLSYSITGLEPGEDVVITLVYPDKISEDYVFYKYNNLSKWHQLPLGSKDGDEILTINLIDGGVGDDDQVVNGEILDPGGIAVPTNLWRGPGLVVGNCFIATAAYGSYQEPNVMVLRDFRDGYLLTNRAGRLFVRAYYNLSPGAADYISTRPVLKSITRALLTPLVLLAKFLLYTTIFEKLFVLLLVVAFSLIAFLLRSTRFTHPPASSGGH